MRELPRRTTWFALAALGLTAPGAAQDAPPAPPLAAPGGAVLDDVPLPAGAQGFDDFLEPAPPAGVGAPGNAAPGGGPGAGPGAVPGAGPDGAPDAQTAGGANGVPVARPYAGSLGAGLAEVRALAEAGDLEEALALTERLLAPDAAGRLRAWLEARSDGLSERVLGLVEGPLDGPLAALGYDPLAPAQRAEVHYARGVSLRAAGRDDDALEAYARALSLGGAARADAVYELGHVELLRGEEWRSQIPELSGAGAAPSPMPPMPPAPGTGRGGDAEEDPLEEARRAFERALAHFVERLRIDWRDADTRANVELVRRRLEELDEVERQRAEQQQEDPQEGDPSDSQDGQPSDEPPPEDGEPQDPQEPGEEEPEPQPEEESEEEPEPAPEEGEDPAGEERPEPEPREVNLTDEEMERLLGRLREHQQRGEEVQAALNARRRRAAARDW